MYDPGGGVAVGGGVAGAGGLAATGLDTLALIVLGMTLLLTGLILLRAAAVKVSPEATGRGWHRT